MNKGKVIMHRLVYSELTFDSEQEFIHMIICSTSSPRRSFITVVAKPGHGVFPLAQGSIPISVPLFNIILVITVAKYILLSTLTPEGQKTLKTKPERIKEVNKEIEAFGVKVVEQYAVLGPYDFVNIVEAPDNDSVFKMSVELGSRGTIKILSMPAVPIDHLIEKLK